MTSLPPLPHVYLVFAGTIYYPSVECDLRGTARTFRAALQTARGFLSRPEGRSGHAYFTIVRVTIESGEAVVVFTDNAYSETLVTRVDSNIDKLVTAEEAGEVVKAEEDTS